MKSLIKRCMSGLLCSALLAGLLPWTAAAEDSYEESPITEEEISFVITEETEEPVLFSEEEAEICPYYTYTEINPLYEDFVTEADLVRPAPPTLFGSVNFQGGTYYDTIEEAAEVLREGWVR